MSPSMSRVGGSKVGAGPVRVNMARVRVPLGTVIVAWVLRRLWAGVCFLALRPLVVLAGLVVWGAWWVTSRHGLFPILATLVPVGAALLVWRGFWPDSFTTRVVWRCRGVWRWAVVYRYSWQPAMVTAGLDLTRDGVELLPRLLKVRSTGVVDLVRVRMLPGQTFADYAAAADRLAQTFGVAECRVRSMPRRHHDLVLWFVTSDPLVDPIPMADPGQECDPARLAVGQCEDGTRYRLRLLGAHLLVVGATGSGKGSVLWSIIAGLCPGIRDGLVQLWALDPKGGMELAFGRPLFTRFVYGDDTGNSGEPSGYERAFAEVLEDAVTVMRRRQSALRGRTRLHQPSPGEPLVVVLVDEIASLTAYITDRDAKKRIDAALSLLLSQGRAVGVLVVGAVQDPRKDVLALRDLFPTRVALRLIEADATDMTLGRGARLRGAKCDEIPESLPGVGYVVLDGLPEPVRVRFCHVTDSDIATLVHRYTRTRSPAAAPDATVELVQLHIVHDSALNDSSRKALNGGDAA
jgi:S-DNA-T family DNA segregation ATPase FtsK/SpoIIIE